MVRIRPRRVRGEGGSTEIATDSPKDEEYREAAHGHAWNTYWPCQNDNNERIVAYPLHGGPTAASFQTRLHISPFNSA